MARYRDTVFVPYHLNRRRFRYQQDKWHWIAILAVVAFAGVALYFCWEYLIAICIIGALLQVFKKR